MESGKSKLANQRKKMFKRIEIRNKMGKPVFFNLTHYSRCLSGFSNKYNYKSNMHDLTYAKTHLNNVKFQSSIITKCRFNNSTLKGVDFFNCNMKNTNFKNTVLEDVVFFNCNLKGASFINVQYTNVVFICTNIDAIKEIDREKIKIYKSYQRVDIAKDAEENLISLSANPSIYRAKVIHVNHGKLNHWALRIINEKYNIQAINYLGQVLSKKPVWKNMYTIYSYMQLLENTYKKCYK